MSSLIAKAAAGIGCAVISLPVLAALVIAAPLASMSSDSNASASPSKHARTDIPPRLLALYQRAALECPGLSWTTLAAIGKVETDHARHPTMVSSAGAVGPMQFLPSTFDAYARPVPSGGKRPPTPWDTVDAVYAAARLLCANGARNGKNVHTAVFAYNHSHAYVNQVLKIAHSYSQSAPNSSVACASLQSSVQSGREHFSSAAALKAVRFACAQVGKPYVWGGNGNPGFDCSGLTRAAYAAAGVRIPRVAQAQYDAGPRLAAGEPLRPGDLVFFGTPNAVHHVGISLGGSLMVNAPRPGRPVRVQEIGSLPDFVGASRPAGGRR